MSQLRKGLIFALIQTIFVASLGAKLLWDRGRLPRGWAATQGYDPDLPIRGRYISVTLLVNADKIFSDAAQAQAHPPSPYGPWNVYLTAENGQVVANPADHYTGLTVSAPTARPGETLARLLPPWSTFCLNTPPIPFVAAQSARFLWRLPFLAKVHPARFASAHRSTAASCHRTRDSRRRIMRNPFFVEVC